ncbi:Small auxin-up RNA [Trema orientale]|uniref:Small auxin-up RNA n=1 Tax=Trema orientale TaxID=63057 RepID=A0A2P5F7R3_TREOI|nr:Small auxin-up RNA [Trema orientale]
MGFCFPSVVHAKQLIQRPFSNSKDVSKGFLAVYVGDDETKMKRFVISVSYLNQTSFQELLCHAKEEFGFDHLIGALKIPCREDAFIDLVSHLNV